MPQGCPFRHGVTVLAVLARPHCRAPCVRSTMMGRGAARRGGAGSVLSAGSVLGSSVSSVLSVPLTFYTDGSISFTYGLQETKYARLGGKPEAARSGRHALTAARRGSGFGGVGGPSAVDDMQMQFSLSDDQDGDSIRVRRRSHSLPRGRGAACSLAPTSWTRLGRGKRRTRRRSTCPIPPTSRRRCRTMSPPAPTRLRGSSASTTSRARACRATRTCGGCAS